MKLPAVSLRVIHCLIFFYVEGISQLSCYFFALGGTQGREVDLRVTKEWCPGFLIQPSSSPLFDSSLLISPQELLPDPFVWFP